MASEIRTKMIASAAFTITLDSLASGSARQSTLLSNSNNYPAANIYVCLQSGASAPVAGALYEVYLIRSDGTITDDGAGASDAAITIENSPLLGTIVVTASTNKSFYGVFDTSSFGPLGSTWGIAIKNGTSQALHASVSTNAVRYSYYVPEAQ
jgi:hypothetical protein